MISSILLTVYSMTVSIIGFSPFVRGLKNKIEYGRLIVILMTIIFLISRNPLAPPDAKSYEIMYKSTISFWDVIQIYHRNYTFSFIQLIYNWMNASFINFLLVQSIITTFILRRGLDLIFRNRALSLFAFSLLILSSTYIFFITNILRQGLATAFFIIALGSIFNKKRKRAIVYFTLSFFSHFSIIVLIIPILFLKKLQDIKLIRSLSILSPILYLVGFSILKWLSTIFSKVNQFTTRDYSNSLIYIKAIIAYVALIVFTRLKIDGNELQKKYQALLVIILFSNFFIFLSLPFEAIASRLLYYTQFLNYIVLAYFLWITKTKLNSLKFSIILISVIAYGIFVFNFPSTKQLIGL